MGESPHLQVTNKGFLFYIQFDKIFRRSPHLKKGGVHMSKYIYRIAIAIILMLIAKD